MTKQKDHPTHEEEPFDQKEEIADDVQFESASVHPKQIMITDEELKTLQKERMEYKDKYLRLLAESDNARKRLQKEREELTRYAVEQVIGDFLHPLDNLENALRFAQEMSDEVKNWALGFQMILTQFKDVLSQNNVTEIHSIGQLFDHELHEAIEMIESDKPEGTVVEECVRGYRMGNRVIRPARVKVSKDRESSTSSQELKNKE